MKNFFEVLQNCSLFSQINESDLSALLTCLGAQVKSFPKKSIVLAEGSAAKNIGIVLSGSVSIEQVDYYGNRSVLTDAGPSEIFAEAFACAEVDSIPIHVLANEPSEIMFIECHRILYACSNACAFHHQILLNLMKNLANKTILFHQKIEVTSKRTTREKLMTYLMLQAQKHDSDSFTIPFDRQSLADYLAVDRSGLSAEISKLRKEGTLKSNKNHFTLLRHLL